MLKQHAANSGDFIVRHSQKLGGYCISVLVSKDGQCHCHTLSVTTHHFITIAIMTHLSGYITATASLIMSSLTSFSFRLRVGLTTIITVVSIFISIIANVILTIIVTIIPASHSC
jgi:hypothetical protein